MLGSLWESTAAAPVVAPTLAGAVTAETAIIGAGYTGLSTALHLAQMKRDVVVLEAGAPGAGGSGRNGGQVIPGIRHFTDEVVKAYGEELGHRLHAFGAGDADYAFALIRRLGLQCDAHRGGWIQAAENETEIRQGGERCAAWKKRGAPVRILAREEFRALTGTEAYAGGWLDERGGSVQPMSYVRELARAAMSAGAQLFVQSPAVTIEEFAEGWRVRTASGEVKARNLLLAANITTGALNRAAARSQLGVWSFQIATRPMTPGERDRILPGGAVVSDTRRVLRYFRVDRDGRVIVGGKGTLRAPSGPTSFNLQLKMLRTLYPELAAEGFTHAWGGLIGVTPDRLPRLYSLGRNGWAALQDNGKGVAWCTAMGQPLAELMAGKDARALPLVPVTPPQPIPLHALRHAYVAAANTWLRFLDLTQRMR